MESIPDNLTFANGSVTFPSIYGSWMDLLSVARQSIHIASSYWTLRAGGGLIENDLDKEVMWALTKALLSFLPRADPVSDTSNQGRDIFNGLMKAGTERNISIQIAQDQPSYSQPDLDTKELSESGSLTLQHHYSLSVF